MGDKGNIPACLAESLLGALSENRSSISQVIRIFLRNTIKHAGAMRPEAPGLSCLIISRPATRMAGTPAITERTRSLRARERRAATGRGRGRRPKAPLHSPSPPHPCSWPSSPVIPKCFGLVETDRILECSNAPWLLALGLPRGFRAGSAGEETGVWVPCARSRAVGGPGSRDRLQVPCRGAAASRQAGGRCPGGPAASGGLSQHREDRTLSRQTEKAGRGQGTPRRLLSVPRGPPPARSLCASPLCTCGQTVSDGGTTRRARAPHPARLEQEAWGPGAARALAGGSLPEPARTLQPQGQNCFPNSLLPGA